MSYLDQMFAITSKRSNIRTELRCGALTFISTAYLLCLIPHLLRSAVESSVQSVDQSSVNPPLNPALNPSIDQMNVVSAVSICVIVSTVVSSLITNQPIVFVPGLGLTAFYAVQLSTSIDQPNNQASHVIACAFLSSLLLSITSVIQLTNLISRLIPRNLKVASMVGLGLFVSLTGLLMAGIVEVSPHGLTLGRLIDQASKLVIAFTGFITISALMYHRISGGMLFGIVIATFMYYMSIWRVPDIDQWEWPSYAPIGQSMIMSSFRALTPGSIWTILSFYLIQLFDVTTMIHTCSSRSYLSLSHEPINEASNQSPAYTFERKVYLIAGVTSMFASLYGVPPLIIAVESVLAIKSGAKTGLSALTAAALFALCLPFASLLAIIPPIATASCSIVVGSFLVAECGRIPWFNPISSLPAFITIVLIPFTGSVAVGIVAGYFTHIALCLSTGHPIDAWRHEEEISYEGEEVSDAELSEDEDERLMMSTDDTDSVLSHIPGRYGAVSDTIYSPRKSIEGMEGAHF